MLYKLLTVSKSPKLNAVNIGDYIQALASSQYYPQIDGFLDRDEDLKKYNGEVCKVIMNGWYMHNPENWPPSDKIEPLFVAFHLNSLVRKELLSPESIKYLKKHQPIGCRDLDTMNLLKNEGVEAYFSGCMTLTLGKKFHSDDKNDKVYIVDPIYDGQLTLMNLLKALYEIIHFPDDIFKLFREPQLCLHHGRNFIKRFLKTALYHREYSRIFGRSLIMNATYINQENAQYKNHFDSDKKRMHEAQRLVELYAKASLVITSRIHCALPCLGLETPVIFLGKEQDTETSSCRLNGLRELFNIVSVDHGILNPLFKTSYPVTQDNCPGNKRNWVELAQGLDQRCTKFMKSKK